MQRGEHRSPGGDAALGEACDRRGGGESHPTLLGSCSRGLVSGGSADSPVPARRSDAPRQGQAQSVLVAAGVAQASSAKHLTGIPAMGDGWKRFLQKLEIPRGGLWPGTNPYPLQSAKSSTPAPRGAQT